VIFGALTNKGLYLAHETSRLNVDNGRLEVGSQTLTSGTMVSGPGRIQLDGPAYFSNPLGNFNSITSAIVGSGSLTKEDYGVLELRSLDNAYTGNTTVKRGTLSIASPFLSTASTVSIDYGGYLELDFTGINVVDTLMLGGAAATAGVYDQFTAPEYILGTGQLQVTGSGTPVTSLKWYGNGVAAGGSGSWSPSAGTWSNGTVVRTWASSAEARFDSVGGTVTVHPTGVSAGNGISFQADGYYLQGGPVTLSAATAAENVIEVAAAATANLAVPVEGQNGLTKAGLGQLVLASDNGLAGPTSVAAGTLEVASNNALAASPVTVAQGATLFVSPGTTMKSPAVTLAGGTLSANTLAVDGGSGIQVLTIDAGTLAAATALTVGTGGSVDVAEGTRVVVGVDSLSVGSGGLIDLGAGGITVAAGGISATTLRQLILQGRGDGSWTGTEGITSATAAAIAGTRSVGYRVEADGSAFVSFAAPGDVNLDGAVNSLDLVMISASGTFGTGVPSVWSQGDVNYDGVTNTLDLVAISAAGVFGQGNYFPAAPSITPAAVPEPTGLALAVTAALGGLVVSLRARHRRPGRGRIA